jgi:hypothetical protein
MDSTLHTHIAALHLQDRIARATEERTAREVRATDRTPRRTRRAPWRRHVWTAPRSLGA